MDEDQVEVYEDESIVREFKIKTNQRIGLGEIVYLFDEDSGKTHQVVFADGCSIIVGPFTADKNETKFIRSFRLMKYTPLSGLKLFFGPRFGFCVAVKKKECPTMLTNFFRKEIEDQK